MKGMGLSPVSKARKPNHDDSRAQGRLGRKLAVLRVALNKTQSQLARESRVKRASISQYEADLTMPDASTLERLLSAMGFPWSALDLADRFLDRLTSVRVPSEKEPDPLLAAEELETAAARLVEMADRLTSMARTLRGQPGDRPAEETGNSALGEGPVLEDKTAARQFFLPLRDLPPSRQAERLEEAPTALLWALCELLCIESQRLCATDPGRGVELAELAVGFAVRAPGKEAWRSKLQGLAWAHVGNAQRALGQDLPAAEATFSKAEAVWEAGGEVEEASLLEAGLICALKASLRRAQRRFAEAAELLEQASAQAGSAAFRAQVLISRAKLADELGEPERAVAILRDAGERVVPEHDGRIVLCIQHNLADVLSKLDRFAEADALLPAVRELFRRFGGEIDATRLLWVEGRIAAGLGRVEEGLTLLSKVRGQFVARSMGYDAALVTLELCLLHVGQGRADQVKTLARHMAKLFYGQEFHREALSAFTLFRHVAEQERVTMELARRFLSYLRKARIAPDLRFEG